MSSSQQEDSKKKPETAPASDETMTHGAENPSAAATLDGNAFLSHLRANNDDIIGTSNTHQHRRSVSSLSGVFDTRSMDLSGSEEASSPGARLPLPPRPPSIHQRNRTVSWSKEATYVRSYSSHLMQPTLDGGTTPNPNETRFNLMIFSRPVRTNRK